MLRKMILVGVVMMAVSSFSWAQGKYSIKEMTPEVQQALNARKDRFGQLRSLKSSGAIGENNRGYVEVVSNDPSAASVVSQENQDRKIVYQTIAQQNDLQGVLSTIESAFAEVQRDKAESGDKVQTEDGRWITK